jgi:hypothetical protein
MSAWLTVEYAALYARDGGLDSFAEGVVYTMWQRTVLTAMLVGGCVLCFMMVPEASSQGTGSGLKRDLFKPAASVHSLMEAQDYHFDQMKEQIASDKDNRFKILETQAEILAELANVNGFHQEKEDYVNWASQMRSLALDVAKAAKAKDPDKAKGLISQINKNCCTACHDVYQ